jgi:hypothetical protein
MNVEKIKFFPIDPIIISLSEDLLDEMEALKVQNKLYEKLIRIALDELHRLKKLSEPAIWPRKWISKEEALKLWPNGNKDSGYQGMH